MMSILEQFYGFFACENIEVEMQILLLLRCGDFCDVNKNPRADHLILYIDYLALSGGRQPTINILCRAGLYLNRLHFTRLAANTKQVGVLEVLKRFVQIDYIIPSFHQFQGDSSFSQFAKLL